MGDAVIRQDCHNHGNSDAIIAPKGGAFGRKKISLQPELQAVGGEIKIYIRVLFAYHVQVALQNDGGMVFVARSGGLFDNDVVVYILDYGKS